MFTLRPLIAATLAACTLTIAPVAQADTVALNFTGGASYGFVTSPLPNSIGWEFNLSSAVSVSALGFLDMGNDGLAAAHTVSIWSPSQSLLGSAVVDNGSLLSGGFRWTDIAPLVLDAGVYRISANVNNDDLYISGASGIVTASPVSYLGGVYGLGTTAYPSSNTGFTSQGRFGPNFTFTTPAVPSVPEPGSLALVVLAGAAAWGLRRR